MISNVRVASLDGTNNREMLSVISERNRLPADVRIIENEQFVNQLIDIIFFEFTCQISEDMHSATISSRKEFSFQLSESRLRNLFPGIGEKPALVENITQTLNHH